MNIEEIDPAKTPLQNVKQRFFALRNGMLADMIRKSGSPYKIIFGLNLPQIREVASAFGTDRTLAETLWANDTTRESRLMAPLLVDPATFTLDDARKWISTLTGSVEEVDILCWALLRKVDAANAIIEELSDHNADIHRYTALRLAANLLKTNPSGFRALAQREIYRNCLLTNTLARQIIAETDLVDP